MIRLKREIYTLLSKAWFHAYMVVTVVKIESQSFSSAEIQHFGTENTRSDYNERMIYMWFTGINYYKLAVEKDRDSSFTSIWKPGLKALWLIFLVT
jgi:hypothetical protein